MQITSKAIAQTRPAFSRASLSFTFLAFVALLWMQTLAAAQSLPGGGGYLAEKRHSQND